MDKVTQSQFASNALWKFSEIICRKVISLVVSTILARLLLPEDYGLVALTTVFITFSDIFILNGFNIALVRKEKVTDLDYSTVMVLSISFSFILYVIFFLIAPFIADFYKTPELKLVLRVMTILLFFQAVATVVRAKATRELKFRQMSFVSVTGSLLSSFIGLFMAYKGYGVWALIAQQVLANLFDMLLMLIVFKWHMSFRFSMLVAKRMVLFTFGVLGTAFLDFLGNNANSLVIGKVYTSTDLGYYNRGYLYPETIGLNIYNSVNSVLLPTLVTRQDDPDSMKKVVRKVMSLTEYIVLPALLGLAAVADNFISVLLTDKWMPCIGIIIWASMNYAINPIRAVGYSVFYAIGESYRSVRIEIIRLVMMLINLIVILVLLKGTIYVLAGVNVLISLAVALFTQFQVNQCIGYTYKELLLDIYPSLLMSCVIVVFVRLLCLLRLNPLNCLILQIILGMGIYVALSLVLKNENFLYLYKYVKRKLRK